MGYYTHYTGGVSGPQVLLDKFNRDAENGAKYGQYDANLDDWTYGEFFGGDTAKWYDWEKDMQAVSSQYPHLLFFLEGEGEEAGDIWKAWARNGKVITVRARIVFDEPDLDRDLPTPDIEAAIEAEKQKKRDELDAEIARLQAQKDAL